jgi:hypothetical protein
MTLVAGSRLGPYEIVAGLGAGGMGETYLSRGMRLGRDVTTRLLALPGRRSRLSRLGGDQS